MRFIVRIEHIEHEGTRYYRMGDLDGNAYRWEKLSDCHQIFIAEDDEFKALEIAYRECLIEHVTKPFRH